MKFNLIVATVLHIHLLLSCSQLAAQDTLFYNNENKQIASIEKCRYYKLLNTYGENVLIEEYYKSGQIRALAQFLVIGKKKVLHGIEKKWYGNGNPKSYITYSRGKRDGDFKTYWGNGILKRFDKYKSNKLLSGKCWSSRGELIEYYPYRIMPSFKGGEKGLLKFLDRNVTYPKSMYNKGFQGLVRVQFVVDKVGHISDIQVVKSVRKELDNEAVRVVKAMPDWIPGRVDGLPVNVQFILPIRFNINIEHK